VDSDPGHAVSWARNMRKPNVTELRSQWESGNAMAVGSSVYEALGPADRVRLASELLRASVEPLPKPPAAITHVLAIAQDPARWRDAHDAFTSVRLLTLEALQAKSRGHDEQIYEAVLYVAENAAKVIYNASGEPAPFDHDCGYWLVGCVHRLAHVVGSVELKERFWRIVAGSISA
jgi:hypothetical protein